MIDFEVCLFLLYGFFYYLWNLFVFVGKNIDWRLPSMKLVVSIMLYGTHSQSSHQSENERWSFSKKKYIERWCILQMFRRDGLSKKIVLEYDLSYIMRKDGISFSRKYDIFFTDWKWKRYFSKNTWKYDVFCMLAKIAFLFPTNMKLPFCQKSKDDLFRQNAP